MSSEFDIKEERPCRVCLPHLMDDALEGNMAQELLYSSNVESVCHTGRRALLGLRDIFLLIGLGVWGGTQPPLL